MSGLASVFALAPSGGAPADEFEHMYAHEVTYAVDEMWVMHRSSDGFLYWTPKRVQVIGEDGYSLSTSPQSSLYQLSATDTWEQANCHFVVSSARTAVGQLGVGSGALLFALPAVVYRLQHRTNSVLVSPLQTLTYAKPTSVEGCAVAHPQPRGLLSRVRRRLRL